MSATQDAMSGVPLLEVLKLAVSAGGVPSGRVLFNALSFAVRPGERWVVLGPNGAGKSSLLAALAGVLQGVAGEVRVDGCRLSAWSLAELADRRAWCPQFWSDPFPATVIDSVQLARRRGGWWQAVASVADPAVGMVLDRLELRALSEVDVRTLSGGERQRVAIATALLQDAPVLLLDEPASHLDLAHQRLLLDLLLDHAAGGGAIVASLHDINLAWDLASHVVLLDGRGGALAGERGAVMTAAHLGAVFGVALDAVDVGGRRRFWRA